MAEMRNIGIVGFGRVGTALATALEKKGYEIFIVTRAQSIKTVSVNGKEAEVFSLRGAARNADILFITTPDGVIGEIAGQLARLKDKDLKIKAALHMSGSQTSGILEPLQGKGISLGSIHPLQSFATVEQAIANLPGSYFTYEGDEALKPWITRFVAEMDGVLNILPSAEMKAIYHVGAVFVSNYMVALAQLGTECLVKSGFSAEEAQKALLPLMKGTLNNISHLPLTQALTGPVSRGDMQVVAGHVKILQRELPTALPPYLTLVPALLALVKRSGSFSDEKLKKMYGELSNMLKEVKSNE